MHLPPPPLVLALTFALGVRRIHCQRKRDWDADQLGRAALPERVLLWRTASGSRPPPRTAPPRSRWTASVSPRLAKTYAAALVSCLTACLAEVSSTEALVEQFCAAAMKPTSLSFPSFVPSSTSASASSSAASNSSVGSSTAMPPAGFSSPPPSTTSNAAFSAHPLGMGVGVGRGVGGVAMTVAGVLLGAALLR
ncbi:hypothetical protein FB451DRAFT_1416899 [Mycena latifolia]|nr:hypothetical protein FB451DRAFT_1416899 [Mycena latifolia]